jgi:hypothetical protein
MIRRRPKTSPPQRIGSWGADTPIVEELDNADIVGGDWAYAWSASRLTS